MIHPLRPPARPMLGLLGNAADYSALVAEIYGLPPPPQPRLASHPGAIRRNFAFALLASKQIPTSPRWVDILLGYFPRIPLSSPARRSARPNARMPTPARFHPQGHRSITCGSELRLYRRRTLGD